MWTVGNTLKWTIDFFKKKGIETPRLDAEILLAFVLKKERIYLYVNFDQPLEPTELAAYRELVKKRAARLSVAHIIGRKEFMGLSFAVSTDTLVPRPETEILVGAATERLAAVKGESFADIGTGSGAIAVSVCRFLPKVQAVATDISENALKIAEQNARELETFDRTEFFCGDLTEPIKDRKFTAILSNPPYIPQRDAGILPPEVQAEPACALFGGNDGLDFYRRLAEDAPLMLNDKGFIAVEVGINQASIVAELFKKNSAVGKTEIIKDLAHIERVVVAWKQE